MGQTNLYIFSLAAHY